jgi:hypothetical protein
MNLTARRHSTLIPYLVYVLSDEIPAPANVVAKANLKTGEVWRTTHIGTKPAMKDIRHAVGGCSRGAPVRSASDR